MKAYGGKHQQGMFLIEALIAILIFAFGILGMVAMGGAAVNAQSDAQYRTEAANLADRITSTIALNVDRSSAAGLATSLSTFALNESGTNCAYTGAAANPVIAGLLTQAAAGLPGGTAANQQILVENGVFNRVTVTLCWKTASDAVPRRHSLVTYINRE
jgi:type IV pilus assembly protein PilV